MRGVCTHQDSGSEAESQALMKDNDEYDVE